VKLIELTPSVPLSLKEKEGDDVAVNFYYIVYILKDKVKNK